MLRNLTTSRPNVPGVPGMPGVSPVAALTTYELRDYRRQIEDAVAFFDRQDPVPDARADWQARLDDVLAEQESRRKIADA
jgi:hypothetical protein